MNRKSDEILERLKQLHPATIDLSLKRVHRLLAKLGNPERKLPPVVHIAGTNGKGSTLAFMRGALEAAGYKCHAYTSPYLVTFHEQILLAGQIISEPHLCELLETVEQVNDGDGITFYEIVSVAALLAFAQTPADIVLLETGLGGRLDATNVIDEPKLTIITPIAMDHEEFLGNTIYKIAAEKAGIIKTMSPVCVAPQEEAALKVILDTADQRISRVRALGHNLPWGKLGRRFYLAPKEYPAPAMLGDHQVTNAATAMAALDMLEPAFDVPMSARIQALETVQWAGRLQPLHDHPLRPEGYELWVDGGHNPAAGEVLAGQLKDWAEDGGDTHLIIGMLNTKDARGYLLPILPHAASIQTVAIPGQELSLCAEELAVKAEGTARATIEDALANLPEDGGRVLICGSLYLVGHFMAVQAAPALS